MFAFSGDLRALSGHVVVTDAIGSYATDSSLTRHDVLSAPTATAAASVVDVEGESARERAALRFLRTTRSSSAASSSFSSTADEEDDDDRFVRIVSESIAEVDLSILSGEYGAKEYGRYVPGPRPKTSGRIQTSIVASLAQIKVRHGVVCDTWNP